MIYVKKSILLAFFLTLKAVFIAIQQSFDIFAVTHPGHKPEYDADSKQMPLPRIKDQNADRKGQAHIEGADRNISGCKKDDKEADNTNQADPQVKRQHHAGSHGDSLAAFKFQVKGIIMTESHTKPRVSQQKLKTHGRNKKSGHKQGVQPALWQ